MIDIDNQSMLCFSPKILERILEYLGGGDVELLCVSEEKMCEINGLYRNKNESTDVLSFPLEQATKGIPLGSIVVCEQSIRDAAQQFGHSIDDEVALLFLHGMLHLLGFNHENDNGAQRQKEEEVVAYFGLPKSLIVRNA